MDRPEEPWVLCVDLGLGIDWLGLGLVDYASRGFSIFWFGAPCLGADCGLEIFWIGLEGVVEEIWMKGWPRPS